VARKEQPDLSVFRVRIYNWWHNVLKNKVLVKTKNLPAI